VFWNTGQPPAGLDDAFAEVYRRVFPASLAARLDKKSIQETHAAMCAKAAGGIEATGAFDEPQQWRFEWAQSYTRDQWLDALQTSGAVMPESQLADLLKGIGDAIDAVGGILEESHREPLRRFVTLIETLVGSGLGLIAYNIIAES
jgi:hypothetical protein